MGFLCRYALRCLICTLGVYGDRLQYAAIKVNLTLSTYNQAAGDALAAKSAWEAFLGAALSPFPSGLQSALVSTPESQTWAWLAEQQDIIQNLFRGIALSIMFQFVVTTLATRNWVLGALAALTSLWVVFVVLGIVAFCGWNIGVIECVVLVLVVPLSSLQTTAIVMSFQHGASDSRKERLRQCLSDCGATAMFVAVAGLGISVFLFGSLLAFAFEYGVVFFSTSILSGMFALIFLAATLGVGGPRRGQGRVWPMAAYVGQAAEPQKRLTSDVAVSWLRLQANTANSDEA